MGRKNRNPLCIEAWCNRRCQERTNYHTMSFDMQLEVEPFHHRCRRCYAGWLVQDQETTKARKKYECVGCSDIIDVGERYYCGFAGSGRRYPTRTHVCSACRNRYYAHNATNAA